MQHADALYKDILNQLFRIEVAAIAMHYKKKLKKEEKKLLLPIVRLYKVKSSSRVRVTSRYREEGHYRRLKIEIDGDEILNKEIYVSPNYSIEG